MCCIQSPIDSKLGIAGVELLQPSTAIAGVLLAVLLGNTVRVAVFALRSSPAAGELALQAQVSQAVSGKASQLASLLGAIAVLMRRRLSGDNGCHNKQIFQQC